MSLCLAVDEICRKICVFTCNLHSWEVLGETWQAEFVAIYLSLRLVLDEICRKIRVFTYNLHSWEALGETWQAEFVFRWPRMASDSPR